jgi:hypothetical protein
VSSSFAIGGLFFYQSTGRECRRPSKDAAITAQVEPTPEVGLATSNGDFPTIERETPATMMYTILSIVLLLVPRGVAGFGFVRTSPLGGRQLLRPSHTHLHGIRCEDKQYQLEEREDAECSTTELYLNTDRSIRFGETDGPLPTEVKGSWQVTPATDDFSMTISRTFGSGREGTDMGEFAFTIVRNYVGEMTMVGECVAITGVMRNQDDTLEDKGACVGGGL